MENQNMNMSGMGCKCPHHKVVPLFIFVIGLIFFLHAFSLVSQRFTDIVWPLVLMLIGLQKMFSHKCNCCSRDK